MAAVNLQTATAAFVKGVTVTLWAKGVDGWITANFLAKRMGGIWYNADHTKIGVGYSNTYAGHGMKTVKQVFQFFALKNHIHKRPSEQISCFLIVKSYRFMKKKSKMGAPENEWEARSA